MRRPSLLFAALVFAVPALAEDTREQPAVTVPLVQRQSPADIRADHLDALFAKLHRVTGERDAKSTEQDIWAVWMSSDSPTAEVLLQQATRAMGGGAFEQSRDILNRLIGAYPDFAEAWNKRATLYFAMGRFTESLADIDKVLELEPRHFGALSGRGMILQRQKNYGAALEAFRDALAINPNMESVKDAVKALEKFEQPI